MKFPIGDVVQQRSQLDDIRIGPLRASKPQRDPPNTIDVMPVVPSAVARKHSPGMIGGTAENFSLIHAADHLTTEVTEARRWNTEH